MARTIKDLRLEFDTISDYLSKVVMKSMCPEIEIRNPDAIVRLIDVETLIKDRIKELEDNILELHNSSFGEWCKNPRMIMDDWHVYCDNCKKNEIAPTSANCYTDKVDVIIELKKLLGE